MADRQNGDTIDGIEHMAVVCIPQSDCKPAGLISIPVKKHSDFNRQQLHDPVASSSGLVLLKALNMWFSNIVMVWSICWTASSFENQQSVRLNANHIFNAIHSSMRQWGSSLNHNGMSIFPAIVPAGTLLYHGRDTNSTVPGLEWVAFERDHSLNFAHVLLTPLPGLPDQHVLKPPQKDMDGLWSFPGFLQVHKAKQDLQLLYLDGSAAAKTSKGTLDTTDLLLRNLTVVRLDAEHDRAKDLCRMSREDWQGNIDGFIRMEAGFEIIICSFPESLELVEALRTESMFAADTMVDPKGMTFHWLRAASNRYDGIGGMPRRVHLNYEKFFTAYAFDIDFFQDGELPRLKGASQSTLQSMRHALRTIIHQPDTFDDLQNRYDWQGVADMIVRKYASPLQALVSADRFTKRKHLAIELNYMLRPYIDTSDRDAREEIRRCIAEFFAGEFDTVAGQAIFNVTHQICSTLVNSYWSLHPWQSSVESMEPQTVENILQSLKELVSWLAWPVWKRCRGCDWDQICSIPMFPFGFTEDHEEPRCRGQDDFEFGTDYWFNEVHQAT